MDSLRCRCDARTASLPQLILVGVRATLPAFVVLSALIVIFVLLFAASVSLEIGRFSEAQRVLPRNALSGRSV